MFDFKLVFMFLWCSFGMGLVLFPFTFGDSTKLSEIVIYFGFVLVYIGTAKSISEKLG